MSKIQDVAAVIGFIGGQEIEQKSGYLSLPKLASDEIVAWAKPPAAASVGKDHYFKRLRRKAEDSFKGKSTRVSRTADSFMPSIRSVGVPGTLPLITVAWAVMRTP
jgi:hypothetical protein